MVAKACFHGEISTPSLYLKIWGKCIIYLYYFVIQEQLEPKKSYI